MKKSIKNIHEGFGNQYFFRFDLIIWPIVHCSSVSLLYLAMYWILSKVEYLSILSLPDEVTDWLFFVCYFIINLAQLVSLSVVLPAELVFI